MRGGTSFPVRAVTVACPCGYIGDSDVVGNELDDAVDVIGKLKFGNGLEPMYDERTIVKNGNPYTWSHMCPECGNVAEDKVYLDTWFNHKFVTKPSKYNSNQTYQKKIGIISYELKTKEDLGYLSEKKWKNSIWRTTYWKMRKHQGIDDKVPARIACKNEYVSIAYDMSVKTIAAFHRLKARTDIKVSLFDKLVSLMDRKDEDPDYFNLLVALVKKYGSPNAKGNLDLYVRTSVDKLLEARKPFIIVSSGVYAKDKTTKWDYSKWTKCNDLLDPTKKITVQEWAENYLEKFNKSQHWSMDRGKIRTELTKDNKLMGYTYDPAWKGEYEIGDMEEYYVPKGVPFFGKPPKHYNDPANWDEEDWEQNTLDDE